MAKRKKVVKKEPEAPVVTGATVFDEKKHYKVGDQIYQKPTPVVAKENAVAGDAPSFVDTANKTE